ncbi:hypothetical protein ACOSQ2_018982 [Xanthoceras sorbifolium]
MKSNLDDKNSALGLGPSNRLFVWVLWFIWKWRCAKIFDERFCMPIDIRKVIYRIMKEWNDSCKGEDGSTNKVAEMIYWQPPANGWVKINVDGSMKGKKGNHYNTPRGPAWDCNSGSDAAIKEIVINHEEAVDSVTFTTIDRAIGQFLSTAIFGGLSGKPDKAIVVVVAKTLKHRYINETFVTLRWMN